uniref:AF4/FMR2 family, member 2 n=1 Tax=Poecilia latipinna TaxID=48699 RepID=A0A3B3V8Y7_9TELE
VSLSSLVALLFLYLCSHLESERSALKRREWERRNQEVQQDEDLFSTGFNLFGEPYKTNKGDALANRVQNTLGSYEEMKDLLTSHSNQSHLVGIPKGSAGSNNQHGALSSASMQPPAVVTSLSNAAAAPHQNAKKSRSSMEWSKGGQATGLVVGSGAPGQNGQGQVPAAAAASRGKMALLEEQHSHLSLSSSPLASTSVLTTPTPGLTTPTSGLTTPTFPPGCLSGKPIAVQQKPTAYVRPMDGQDQAPSDSPQLKPPPVATEGFSSSQSFGGTSGNVKNKLPKLNLSHTGEEMTHSWPPPLTAIHTPGKADQTKFPIPNKVSTHFANPEPPSTNKWQLDSWLNKVQAQTKPLVPTQQEHHGAGYPGREKAKAKLGQKASGEGQRSKMRLSPGLLSGQEVPAPRRNTTGKKQPRRAERSSSVEENQNQAWSRTNQHRKHRGPSTKITPKSREFIETDSSSSSSECQSDGEEATKILSILGTFAATGLRVKDGVSTVGSGGDGVSNGQGKDAEPASPPSNVGHDVALSPLREYHEVQSLWVKIDLSFLSRVPEQTAGERARIGVVEREGNAGRDRERQKLTKGERQEEENERLVKDKERQGERERQTDREDRERFGFGERERTVARDREKISQGMGVLDNPPGQEQGNPRLAGRTERLENGGKHRRQAAANMLLPPLLSPLSDEPPRKRACDGGPSLTEEAGAVGMLPCSASSSAAAASSHRHRRGEGKATAHARNGGVSVLLEVSEYEMAWIYSHSGNAGPTRVVFLFLLFSRVHSAEYYMQEAKRLKHKADALTDKFGKAVNYADGALSFIECGNAMERDPLEAKSPYTMYSETVELIRYAMRLKNFTSHSATVLEKRLAVLCNRCLSLLYLRMFHLKKDHAVKYSRSLMDKTPRLPAGFPSCLWDSPPVCVFSRVNGTPSPLSLSPSPASSGGAPAAATGGGGASGSSSSVAIPQRIHHMAASHVNITNNILRSYEQWETADRLAADSRDFFQDLDSAMGGALSQQSSMVELVRYIRQGLHWLRSEAQLL